MSLLSYPIIPVASRISRVTHARAIAFMPPVHPFDGSGDDLFAASKKRDGRAISGTSITTAS